MFRKDELTSCGHLKKLLHFFELVFYTPTATEFSIGGESYFIDEASPCVKSSTDQTKHAFLIL